MKGGLFKHTHLFVCRLLHEAHHQSSTIATQVATHCVETNKIYLLGEEAAFASMAPNLFPVSEIFSSFGSPIQFQKSFINYAVVDAFTDTPFKGNPAAVCLLPVRQDSHWMQQVASEFNLSQTAFLVRRLPALEEEPFVSEGSEGASPVEYDDMQATSAEGDNNFDIRWFTPSHEVDLCGHATLASAYLLFLSGMVSCNLIHFHTRRSGVLLAQKVERYRGEGDETSTTAKKVASDKFLVELNFPLLSTIGYDFSGMAVLSETFKGTKVLSVQKTTYDDLLVELSSGEEVESLQPHFDEVKKCNARGIIVTGCASDDSGFDFISRFFAPKLGIDEDPVCGQAHCALARFWAEKLGKQTLTAYQASRRGGMLHLRADTMTDRVYIQGEAVIVMSGVLVNK